MCILEGFPSDSLSVQKLLSAMLRKLGLTQSPGNFGLKQYRLFYSELIRIFPNSSGALSSPPVVSQSKQCESVTPDITPSFPRLN